MALISGIGHNCNCKIATSIFTLFTYVHKEFLKVSKLVQYFLHSFYHTVPPYNNPVSQKVSTNTYNAQQN